jgi:hypothetical protein
MELTEGRNYCKVHERDDGAQYGHAAAFWIREFNQQLRGRTSALLSIVSHNHRHLTSLRGLVDNKDCRR